MTNDKDVRTRNKTNPRVGELVEQFAAMSPDDALKQISIHLRTNRPQREMEGAVGCPP